MHELPFTNTKLPFISTCRPLVHNFVHMHSISDATPQLVTGSKVGREKGTAMEGRGCYSNEMPLFCGIWSHVLQHACP